MSVFEIKADCSPKKLQELTDALWDICDGFGLPSPVLHQCSVSGSLPLVSRDELISSLDDKRICNMSNLPAKIYYLSRKETADHLIEKYAITKRQ